MPVVEYKAAVIVDMDRIYTDSALQSPPQTEDFLRLMNLITWTRHRCRAARVAASNENQGDS